MKIETTREKLDKVKADGLVIPLFEGEKPSGEIAKLDKAVSESISESAKIGEFSGKLYETTSIFTHKKVPSTRILLVGAGKKSNFDSRLARNLAGVAARKAAKIGIKKLAIYLRGDETSEAAVEGVFQGIFDPGLYKTKKEPGQVEDLIIIGKMDEETKKHAVAVSEATNWVRRLVNEPPNFMTPTRMVEEARKLSRKYKLELEVIDEKEAEKKGFGAFIGVAKGSDEPSYVVTLKYKGGGKETLGIAGKGITYDTGGISLKPPNKMTSMKGDMAGAAAAFGAMQVVGQLRPKLNVITVCPLTENMPSGRALKPDDVVKTLSGKTVEITNTDAEGRVVLADALTYLQKQGANKIVDLATLTGAVLVVFGHEAAAVIGSSQAWVEQIIKASEKAGERVWQLPMYEEYKSVLRSDVADIANAYKGHPEAGTIAGAVFLNEFIEGKSSWAHLDIAGTAWLEDENAYTAKGATGFGVRSLVKLIELLEK